MSETKPKSTAATPENSKSTPKVDGAAASPKDETDLSEEVEAPTKPDGIIDMETFQQIRDMDEDDEEEEESGGGISHEFSRGIVWGFFEQAEGTFKEMEQAIQDKNLAKLSSLGHFLKGSSAALGIIKVRDSCEKMQHYGNLRDEEANETLGAGDALERIKKLLRDCKVDYKVARAWMRKLYEEE